MDLKKEYQESTTLLFVQSQFILVDIEHMKKYFLSNNIFKNINTNVEFKSL